MAKKSPPTIPDLSAFEHLIRISDPRSGRGRRHPLVNILVLSVLGVICGADNWVAIEEWARAHREWLEDLLDLSEGIPSHDTFGRVFSLIDPDEFLRAFTGWVEALKLDLTGKVVAIDGKTLRRSHQGKEGRSAIHMVQAWCTEAGVALGQVATSEKSNEITAIPELLKLIRLKGAIVTTDAMGCQRDIATAIRTKEADYLLAVRDNHPTLASSIQKWFNDAQGRDFDGTRVATATLSERGHGRIEERTVWVAPVPEDLPGRTQWTDLRSIIWAECVRTSGDKTSVYHRYFISSLPAKEPSKLLNSIREHWGVENGLHWVLDVAFREDDARIRVGYAAENMARLRQFALNLLKQEKTAKVGIKIKRLKAGWEPDYLLKVLGVTV